MTIIKDSSNNDVKVCDGCGREDAGPNQPLHIQDYAVWDANVGSKVHHHYCTGCAANRNASIEVLTFVPEVTAQSLPIEANPVPDEVEAVGDVGEVIAA